MSISLFIRMHGHRLAGRLFPLQINPRIEIPFRCYPLDSASGYMTNSSIIRFAELSRWRILGHTRLDNNAEFPSLMKGVFIVVEQSVVHIEDIKLFQKFVVSTKITSSANKWLLFEHRFIQDPSTVKEGNIPKEFCVVNTRCVVKEISGKTFYVDQIKKLSEWSKAVIDAESNNYELENTMKLN